jgi:hypothetical protein
MKILIIILSFINGGFMLVDGIHVMLKGKYIGPPKPGPWANLFEYFGVDVFQLGPLFVLFGIAWLSFVVGILTQQSWTYTLGVLISALTLWYLPVGTLFSVIVLVALMMMRSKMGI